MKLKFGVLWIEDSYSPQEEEELKNGAGTAGFELEITNSIDGSDLAELAEKQHKFHMFDLVLLDLNLAAGVKGDKLAPEVRRLFRTTPILFYSGSDTETGLRTRMAKDKIEGVFCSNRDNFTTRASELIQDYAHTLNRLSGMRGLAMEVVAEVDIICRSVVKKLAEGELALVATDHLDNAIQTQSNGNLQKYPALGTLNDRLDHPATDSMKSFKLFRELLRLRINGLEDGEIKDNLRALRASTKDYAKEVIEVRNVLGHAIESRNEKGWLILDRHGKPFMTVADFPTYRSNFLKYLRSMRTISDVLIPEDGE